MFSKFKTSRPSNDCFAKNLFFKSDDDQAIFRQEKKPGSQKQQAISRQEKMALSSPRWVALGLPSPPPRVCTGRRTDGRTEADVTTKISCIDGLPKSPIHALEGSAIAYRALCYEYGAPLARAADTRGSSALAIRVHQVIIAPSCLPPPPFTSKLNRAQTIAALGN